MTDTTLDRGKLADGRGGRPSKLDRLPWGETIPLDIDGLGIGVRTSSPALTEAISSALVAHVEEDRDVDPVFSIVVSDGSGGRPYHLLYEGERKVARSRDLGRVVTALFRYLAWQVRPAGSDDVLRLDGTALVREGTAVLAPREVRYQVARMGRRLADAGITMVEMPGVCLVPAGPSIVVPDVALAVDWSMLAISGEGSDSDPAVPTGDYPLKGCLFLAQEAADLRAAVAVVELLRLVPPDAGLDAPRTLDLVAQVAAAVPSRAVGSGRAVAFASELVTGMTEICTRNP